MIEDARKSYVLRMIGEIKRRMYNGETVELECIDVKGFTSGVWGLINKRILKTVDRFVVSDVFKDDVNINDGSFRLSIEDLKYFKIKENKNTTELRDMFVIDNKSKEGEDLMHNIGRATPEDFKNIHFENISQDVEEKTFNDLIDVAVQAYKDGEIKELIICGSSIREIRMLVEGNKFHSVVFDRGDGCDHSEEIKRIKALYKEVFTIESEDDFDKIKIGAKVELCNGSILVRKNAASKVMGKPSFIDIDGNYYFLGILILKGATVTQGEIE